MLQVLLSIIKSDKIEGVLVYPIVHMSFNVESHKETLVRVGAAVLTMASLGLAKDNQPTSHQEMSAPRYNPSLRVELPNVQVPVGEYETLKGRGVNGQAVEILRIYGDKDPDNRITKLVIRDDDVPVEMAKELVRSFFIPDPLPNYLDRFTFWTNKRPANTDRTNIHQEIAGIIDDVISATGVIPLETLVLHKSDGAGGGVNGSFDWRKPQEIHNYAAIWLPEKLSLDDPRRLVVVHEDLHLKWLGDESLKQLPPGSSIIQIPGHPNCSRTPESWGWSKTSFMECEYDQEAMRPTQTSIMRELVPFLGEVNSRWLKETMNTFRWQQPKLALRMLTPEDSFDKRIGMNIPFGTKRIHYKLDPPPNPFTGQPDGPGINLIISDPTMIKQFRKEGLAILAPKIGEGNYVLLPGMKNYALQVRISDAQEEIGEDSPRWKIYHPWPNKPAPLEEAKINFSTPKPSSDGITAVSPKMGEFVDVSGTVLEWVNSDLTVYYNEVRASSDCQFKTDPKEAVAPVWHNLIHGGMTDPQNSWKTPQLELGKEYCWQVRPRVQGDGTPVKWSQIFSFITPIPAGLK